jgi:hypothetical protein
VIDNPIRTMEQVKQVTRLQAEESCPFVGESLRILRQEARAPRGGGTGLGGAAALVVCAAVARACM